MQHSLRSILHVLVLLLSLHVHADVMLCSTPSSGLPDDISSASTPAHIQPAQLELLKTGDAEAATKAIVALTANERDVIALVGLLPDLLSLMHADADGEVVRRIAPELTQSASDRRLFLLWRVADRLRVAHDINGRRSAIDGLLSLLGRILEGQRPPIDSAEVPRLISVAVWPSAFVVSTYADDKAIDLLKRSVSSENERLRQAGASALVRHAARDAKRRESLLAFVRQHAPGEQMEGVLRLAQLAVSRFPETLSYEEWSEARDHPSEVLGRYLQGADVDYGRFMTAVDALLEQAQEDDRSFDMLLKVAGYAQQNRDILLKLAWVVPESAPTVTKAKVDRLLAVHRELVTKGNLGDPLSLGRIVLPADVLDLGLVDPRHNTLSASPPYGRDRVVELLWMLVDGSSRSCAEQAVRVLSCVAWTAPDTAKEVLATAERRLAQIEGKEQNDSLRNRLKEAAESARKATERYGREFSKEMEDKRP